MLKFFRKIISFFPKPLQNLYYKYEEVLMYLVFGVLTTIVSFLTAGIAKWLLENAGATSYVVSTVSTVFSWICSVTFAYVTNRLWVFKSNAKGAYAIVKEMLSFYGGRVFTLIVETVIMGIGNGNLKFNYWITKIAANVIVLILNYIISKLLVFRKKKTD